MLRGCWVAVFAVASVVASSRAEVVDRIVATVDGDPITARELAKFRSERNADAGLSDSAVLDALITEKCLQREANALGITATDADIDGYIKEVKQKNHLDDDHFKDALAHEGLTMEQYRERVKGELERNQLVNREIRGRVNVSPEEVRRYYDAHLDDYAVSERVTVRDIFFRVEPIDNAQETERIHRKAQEVRQLAMGGRSFEELAKQFSEGAGADKGGLLGTFARGEVDAELEPAVFALSPGQVSDVVRTDRGFHILRVDKFEPPGYRSLDEARDQIKETLYQKAVEQRFQDWLSKDLRERHSVEVFN